MTNGVFEYFMNRHTYMSMLLFKRTDLLSKLHTLFFCSGESLINRPPLLLTLKKSRQSAAQRKATYVSQNSASAMKQGKTPRHSVDKGKLNGLSI